MTTQIFSIILSLGIGALIAIQSSWNGVAGRQLGAINTGLLSLAAGGLVALAILLVKRGIAAEALRSSVWYVVGAGVLGILILAGISFTVQRVGVTAGLAGVILGQLLVAFLIDTFGWGGAAIPFDIKRVFGLLLLAVGVYLVLPRG
jgi:bacterial/archaeal transporter family-2 protein